MRAPRFTLRRLMAVVAVAALALGIEMGRRRRAEYLGLAQRHGSQTWQYHKMRWQDSFEARGHRDKASKFRVSLFVYWPQAKCEDELANQLEADSKACYLLAEHHRRMSEKYRRAARSPFWPVEPDPPAPPEPSRETR